MPNTTPATTPAARKAAKKNPQPAAEAIAKSIPDWVDDTPHPQYATLFLSDGTGCNEQSIDMTFEEFIALKQHLAALRGYRRADELKRFASGEVAGHSGESDVQQLAFQLETARDIYAACPSLVVADDMPKGWDQLLTVEGLQADYPEILEGIDAETASHKPSQVAR